MYPTAIQLYSVRQYLKTEGEMAVLEHIAKIGYHAVEGGAGGKDPKVYRQQLRDLGLGIASSSGPFPDAEHANEVIETAQALEVQNVVTGFWIPEYQSIEAIQQTADKLNPAIDRLKQAGLNLCLHNHWFEFEKVEGQLAVERLLELCPGLKLELDAYWAAAFGANDVPALIRKHAARTPLMHLKDGPLVKDQPHTALGQGKLDIPAVVKAADPNVLKWVIVELDECATDMWVAVEESFRFLVKSGLSTPPS